MLVFFIIIYLLFQNFPIQTLNNPNNGNYEEPQKQTDSTEVNELQETTFNSSSSTNFCGELSSEQEKSPEKMKPPKFTPRKKKRSDEPLLENALASLDEMAGKIKNEDACDKFGKYVSSQLRELPLRQRILLQQEIQTAITNSILRNISSDDNPTQLIQHPFTSPNTIVTSNSSNISEESQAASTHSDYSSTDETIDVIKKAMENTFDDFVFD